MRSEKSFCFSFFVFPIKRVFPEAETTVKDVLLGKKKIEPL